MRISDWSSDVCSSDLARRGAEQLLAQLDERVHRPADVEEQQQLDRVAPLRAHADVEPALPRGAVDRTGGVELVGRAFARELAQTAQRDLDVAGAEFLGVVEILELALFPDFQRTLVLALAADPHAFRVVAGVADGRGDAGAADRKSVG